MKKRAGFADYLRGYAASRDGIAIRYMGKSPTDLIRFVEVLRDIELVTPAPREASRAFDDLVREAVRKQLESKVREKILGLDEVATIFNPILTFSIRDREGNPIQIPYYPHLGALDKRHYYVILSHADDSDTQRQNHINQKLGPCGLMAQDPNAGGRVQAIIPPSGYSAGDEKLIFGYTGQQPLHLDVKNIKPLVRSLTEQSGFFAAS